MSNRALELFNQVSDVIEANAQIMDETNSMPKELLAKLRESGLLGALIPKEYGGLGLSLLEGVYLSRFLGGISPALALSTMVNSQVAILLLGNSEVFREYVIKLAKGEIIGGLGITEAEAGSDLSGIKTLVKERNGKIIVDGVKTFLTNGAYADIFTLLAKNEDGEFVLVGVPKKEGVVLKKKLDLAGMRGSGVSVVEFKNVEIDANHVILVGREALKITLNAINHGRLFTAASSVGVAETLLKQLVEWTTKRVVFGKPLSENDYIQQIIGELAARTEETWFLTKKTAEALMRGEDARYHISIVKLNASRVAVDTAQTAMHIMASHGYVKGSLVERLFRDSKALEIMEGTTEIQRMTIFRELLKRTKKGERLISL